ncbi:hypothetical protein TNCV_1625101 [Trichonephila clavipes]|nr:hypothetical protein TNCV_1625101 [Trichonephila clavipes]
MSSDVSTAGKVKVKKTCIQGKGRQAATVVSRSNSSIKYTQRHLVEIQQQRRRQRHPAAVQQQQRQAAISGRRPVVAKAGQAVVKRLIRIPIVRVPEFFFLPKILSAKIQFPFEDYITILEKGGSKSISFSSNQHSPVASAPMSERENDALLIHKQKLPRDLRKFDSERGVS